MCIWKMNFESPCMWNMNNWQAIEADYRSGNDGKQKTIFSTILFSNFSQRLKPKCVDKQYEQWQKIKYAKAMMYVFYSNWYHRPLLLVICLFIYDKNWEILFISRYLSNVNEYWYLLFFFYYFFLPLTIMHLPFKEKIKFECGDENLKVIYCFLGRKGKEQLISFISPAINFNWNMVKFEKEHFFT